MGRKDLQFSSQSNSIVLTRRCCHCFLYFFHFFSSSSSSKGNLDLRLAMTTFFSCKMSQNFTLYIFKTLFFECRIFICNHLVLVKTYKSGPIWTLYTEGRSHQKNLSTALLATHTKALGTDGVTKTDEFSEKFQEGGGGYFQSKNLYFSGVTTRVKMIIGFS